MASRVHGSTTCRPQVITEVMSSYAPGAVVLQCGTDSLSGDKLGCLNLSMRGHANCVRFVKSFNLPLLLLGGGGYTMRNVSRAWAYETGLAAGVELGRKIPMNEYYEYFGPDFELDVKASNMDDLNTPEYLDRVKRIVLENLRQKGGPPGIQLTEVPHLPHDDDDNMEEDMIDPDERRPRSERDRRIQPEGELSDSEDEGEGGRRNHQDQKRKASMPRSPKPATLRPLNDSMELELGSEVKTEATDAMLELPIQTTLGGENVNVNTDGPPSAMRDEPLSPPSS